MTAGCAHVAGVDVTPDDQLVLRVRHAVEAHRRDLSVTDPAPKAISQLVFGAGRYACPPYNIADAAPVRRDEALIGVLSAVLGRPISVVHVPLPIACLGAAVLPAAARAVRREALLTPYIVDTVGRTVVLDTSGAVATGWRADDLMPTYLDHFARR